MSIKYSAPAALALSSLALAGLFGAITPTSALAESATIRIEETPYRGAVVTVEAGVRVYRGLPSQRFVVINPGGKTPLKLDLSETKVTKESRSVSYNRHNIFVYPVDIND